MVIMNMQLIFVIDARTDQTEFKNQGDYRDTYSALGGLRMLVLDPGRLSEHLGIVWDRSQLLKISLTTDSNSSFFVYFSSFVLPFLAASNLYLVSFGFFMYYGMC